MVDLDTLKLDIDNFSKDLPQLYEQISELEREASCEGFWDDAEFAQKETRKLSQLQAKRARITNMRDAYDELEILQDWVVMGELTNAEYNDQIDTIARLVNAYKQETLLSGKYDKEDAILTFHAGSGGTESCDFTDMMLRAVSRWAESVGFTVKLTDIEEDKVAGVASATIVVSGENAYGYAQALNGVFRLVRVSPFDAAGRRHTSFMAIEVIPDLKLIDDIVVNINDCEIQTFRSGGKGGQYQNKTDSGVRLIHQPTGLIAECREERSQLQNKNRCLEKLTTLIYLQQQNSLNNEIQATAGEKSENGWGNAICSIVLMPYQLVKDNRTNWESSQTDKFLSGDFNGFIQSYLEWINGEI